MSKRPKLRTLENADRICELLAEGRTLRQIAGELGCEAPAITCWVREDQEKGGVIIALRYACAREQGYEKMAEEILEIADASCTVDGQPDNALVQKQRLQIDSRKWLLARMLPKRYGDKITQEITGDPDTPFVTRIELVPVASASRLKADDETVIGEAAVTPLRTLPRR